MKPAGESQELTRATGKREIYAEDYLQELLQMLYHYLNKKDKDKFDECIEMVEGILYQKHDVKQQLLKYKKKLFAGLYLRLTEISYKGDEIGSKMKRENYKRKNSQKLEWAFRRDYLQFIVNKFFDKDFIRFIRPDYAKLRGVEDGIHKSSVDGTGVTQ